MKLGNNAAEFVDIFATSSAHMRAISNGVLVSLTPYLHQLHGYHGVTATGNGTSTTLDDYLDDAFDGPASLAWVENETDFDHWTEGGQDVCAVTMTRGNSGADASTRRSNERYDGGTNFSHPSPTSTAWSREWILWLRGFRRSDRRARLLNGHRARAALARERPAAAHRRRTARGRRYSGPVEHARRSKDMALLLASLHSSTAWSGSTTA